LPVVLKRLLEYPVEHKTGISTARSQGTGSFRRYGFRLPDGQKKNAAGGFCPYQPTTGLTALVVTRDGGWSFRGQPVSASSAAQWEKEIIPFVGCRRIACGYGLVRSMDSARPVITHGGSIGKTTGKTGEPQGTP